MKKTLPYLLLLTFSLFFFASCKKNEPLKDVALYVHLQSRFNADSVKIYIDDQKQFDNLITTNDVLSFAGGFSTVVGEGRHQLRVVVNNSVYTEEFMLTRTLYIGVQYHPQANQLSTLHSFQPFVYD